MKRLETLPPLFAAVAALILSVRPAAVSAARPERRAPRVALVYTVTTPELKADVERSVRQSVGGDVELMVYEVPEAFEEIRDAGYVTPHAAARVVSAYMRAVEDGADAVLSICSTVEDVAFSMQQAARFIGVPVVMVNEAMCREAVLWGSTVAVVSTFPSSLSPTCRTLERVAREAGRQVAVREVLAEGGFGMERGQFERLLAERIAADAPDADVVIFTQGSMAYVGDSVARRLGVRVLTNPEPSARAVAEALAAKGLAGGK